MRSIFVFACCLLFAGSALAGEAAPKPPELKRVVLYKHGMGYFERDGKVNGNATLSLPFRQEQMKDLLASFFVLDLSGGKINAVLYDTKEPLSKQIEDILIHVPENNALSGFLGQLKGAKLSVSSAGEKISGRVMGIEPVTEKSKDGQVLKQDYKLVLLTGAGPIRAVELNTVTEFSLEDPALQHDLERLLTLTLDAKYTERKTVTIEADGKGERELVIGYLVEQPIWKASYRLLLDKDPKAEALLQGWAMTENNTEEDWKDVEVSFVAGNPLSYIMDLYTPYYPARPTVPLPGLTGLAVNWGAAPEASADVLRQAELGDHFETQNAAEMKAAKKAPAAPAQAQAGSGGGYYRMRAMKDLAEQSMGAMATGAKVGELFSYDAKEKVSIPRGKAAMIPILSQKLKGERVVYYKAAFSPKAVDAYVLKNDSPLTLDAGAMTVFEDGTSLGEGILSHVMVPGAKEILPYALDAAVSITPQISSNTQPAYKGTLANGILTLTAVESLTNTWKLQNKGKDEKTVLFDQPINALDKLVEPAKAEEEVDNHYRFRLVLKPAESRDFKVVEKRDVYQVIALANLNEDQIRFYARQQYFSDKAKAFFKELSDLQAKRADLVRQIQGAQNEMQRLINEQDQLRSNLNTLRQTPKEEELRAKWVKELGDSQDKITALRVQIDEGGKTQRALDAELAKKVNEYKGE